MRAVGVAERAASGRVCVCVCVFVVGREDGAAPSPRSRPPPGRPLASLGKCLRTRAAGREWRAASEERLFPSRRTLCGPLFRLLPPPSCPPSTHTRTARRPALRAHGGLRKPLRLASRAAAARGTRSKAKANRSSKSVAEPGTNACAACGMSGWRIQLARGMFSVVIHLYVSIGFVLIWPRGAQCGARARVGEFAGMRSQTPHAAVWKDQQINMPSCV